MPSSVGGAIPLEIDKLCFPKLSKVLSKKAEGETTNADCRVSLPVVAKCDRAR